MMLLDEARLVSRISHPNVVPTLDVATDNSEVFVVMEYVQGEVLSRLVSSARRKSGIPLGIISSIIGGVLRGLHAAHEATNERGEPLAIVHRDVSPQNIIVDVDGVSRVLDFGVAKAAGRLQTTQDSKIKGKAAYMAPEQIMGQVTRQSDVYATAVVLWELLTLERLFAADENARASLPVCRRSDWSSQARASSPPALAYGLACPPSPSEMERSTTAGVSTARVQRCVRRRAPRISTMREETRPSRR